MLAVVLAGPDLGRVRAQIDEHIVKTGARGRPRQGRFVQDIEREEVELVVSRTGCIAFPVQPVPGDHIVASLKGLPPGGRHEEVLRHPPEPGAERTAHARLVAADLVHRQPHAGALVDGEGNAHAAAAVPVHVLAGEAQRRHRPGFIDRGPRSGLAGSHSGWSGKPVGASSAQARPLARTSRAAPSSEKRSICISPTSLGDVGAPARGSPDENKHIYYPGGWSRKI